MSTQREVLQQALEAFGSTNLDMHVAASDAIRAALAEQKCPCGDRPAEQCLGEWEPGCDMGSNPKYAKVAEPAPKQKVQEHLSDERINDLLGIGNPTEEEKHLIRMGFNAAHGITGGQP